MKKLLLISILCILLYFPVFLFSQNVAITDDDGYSSDTTAMLDIHSTSKGILIPRLSSAQRTGIVSPAAGLMVYDKDIDAFFYFDGSGWLNLSSKVVNPQQTEDNDALFTVINNSDDTVFAVFPEGVRINVGDGSTKGNRGGFAVGGLTGQKLDEAQFLHVSKDSVRIYFDTTNLAKGNRGGFAVGGLSSNGKGNPVEMMNLTPKNYFIGHESGINNETGINNVFIGYKSGKSNQYGSQNVFLGYLSGFSNTGLEGQTYYGYGNTFLGKQSGFNNETGNYNTFLGYESGIGNVDGIRNVCIGSQAGRVSNTDDNVYIGNVAAYTNDLGTENVMIGAGTGQNSEGSENVFIGRSSGTNNAGSGNVFIGYKAGFSIDGDDQLCINNGNTAASFNLIYGKFDKDSLWLNADVVVKNSLEVGEGIQIGNSSVQEEGVIRWNGAEYQGYIGSDWATFSTAKSGKDIYHQSKEPDIPENTSAFWINSENDNYYLLLDYNGKQKKLLMND